MSPLLSRKEFARLKLALETVSRPHGVLSGYYPGDEPGDFSTYYIRVDLVWQFDLIPIERRLDKHSIFSA